MLDCSTLDRLTLGHSNSGRSTLARSTLDRATQYNTSLIKLSSATAKAKGRTELKIHSCCSLFSAQNFNDDELRSGRGCCWPGTQPNFSLPRSSFPFFAFLQGRESSSGEEAGDFCRSLAVSRRKALSNCAVLAADW